MFDVPESLGSAAGLGLQLQVLVLVVASRLLTGEEFVHQRTLPLF